MNTATAPDGTEIKWTSSGSGAPVVLVHGITENQTFWDPVAQLLTPSFQVITLDLRGHGQSGLADNYDLEAMAGDVATVIAAAGVESPHLVGHSLGGLVVSALGASFPAASVVNVDQALKLDAFQDQLAPFADQLRDPDTFPLVMAAVFDQLNGTMLEQAQIDRMNAARHPVQDMVLGVWDIILTAPLEEIAALVDTVLAGYADSDVPYLSLFGMDPGPDYRAWLIKRIPTAELDLWDGYGHYPHIVDPQRFVATLTEFWAGG